MNRRKFLHISGTAGSIMLTLPGFGEQIFASAELLRLPDTVSIVADTNSFTLESQKNATQWAGKDILIEINEQDGCLRPFLTAANTAIRKIVFTWSIKLPTLGRYLGDQWERSYGDLAWKSMNDFPVKPWYFMFTEGDHTSGIGVKTGPSSFCSWQVIPGQLSLKMDVRNGNTGVHLRGRKLRLCEIITRKGNLDESPFQATRSFCHLLCDKPRLPVSPIYGINDWYFAYGNNSEEDIIRNCIYFSGLVTNSENKPYCVIDEGWAKSEAQKSSRNSESTYNQLMPSTPRFTQMDLLANRIKLEGFNPGIWIRPLWSLSNDPDHITLPTKKGRSENTPQRILDPTIPESQQRISSYFSRAVAWGYQMIKHDYSTYDLLGYWGFEMLAGDLTAGDWHFNDRSKTTAEIIIDLYQMIQKSSNGALLIGCNTVGHLAAGIFELQRTGDDTSGKEWARTKKMGINTLAFRLPHHGNFYGVDADCVGITTEVPWALNKQWMDLLSRSGTALFVSASTRALVPAIRQSIKDAFSRASLRQDHAEPLDWLARVTPQEWRFQEEKITYDWDLK